ncbi:MAG: hypothetical protein KDB10_01695 [Acidimicrobiales bacterium]|nr:hypothetical protein [Acidimicrobiales bacterium]MCB9373571.1 hypothetical protein [Microthrixaceae bacterium]
MSDVSVSADATRTQLAPPGPEELAAIVAAVEVTWPKPVVGGTDPRATTPRWRFSGRWWTKPIPARRDRPA